MKQRVSLAANIIMKSLICLVAAGHSAIVIYSLIQGEMIAMMGSVRAVGQKEDMTFFPAFVIFMVGMNLVIAITLVRGLLKIVLVVVNLYVEVLVITTKSLL